MARIHSLGLFDNSGAFSISFPLPPQHESAFFIASPHSDMDPSTLPQTRIHEEQAVTLLAPLRLPQAEPMDSRYLLNSSLQKTNPEAISHPFDRQVYETVIAGSARLRDKRLVFDLDDTLLNTNYTNGEAWHINAPSHETPTARSINYAAMKRPLSTWLKGRWNKPPRQQYASHDYPFLKNPDVIAQWRPGAFALLQGLCDAGAQLTLATLSSRKRVQFLFERFPLFAQLFGNDARPPQVCCAEDLVTALDALHHHSWKSNSLLPETAKSLQAHQAHPGAPGLKTPLLLQILTRKPAYDLLIDDSGTLQKQLSAHGLGHKLLPISPLHPHHGYTLEMARAILAALESPEDEHPEVPHASDTFFEASSYPYLRFEDPLYFPLIHCPKPVNLLTAHE